jgi:hypothetical protein
MTPALLIALKEERMNHYEALALPLDRLAYMYACSKNVDQRDKDGNVTEKAKALDFNDFRTLYSRKNKDRSLAAKSGSKIDHSLLGAVADRAEFEGSPRSNRQFVPYVPTKEN